MTQYSVGSVTSMIPATGFVAWEKNDKETFFTPIVALGVVVDYILGDLDSDPGSLQTRVEPIVEWDGSLLPLYWAKQDIDASPVVLLGDARDSYVAGEDLI